MDRQKCRMCAKYQNIENSVPLDDNLYQIISYFCRIELELNENLPTNVCSDCNFKLIDFSRYSEEAKEIQLKFLIEHQVHNVKVEIEELPSLYYDKQPSLFIDEPKVEIDATKSESDDEFASSESGDGDWKNDSSSDSDFLADIKKRVKKTSGSGLVETITAKRRRGRPKKLREHVENYTLDVPEIARDTSGVISKKAQVDYEGKKWCDMKLKCTECEHEAMGPFELRSHYFLFHTLDLHFKCPECSETLTYFYQFLNHSIEHQKSLSFCCVVCSQMYWNMKSLNHHYSSDHKNLDHVIKHCKRCGQHFRKPIDLSNHEISIHKAKASRDVKETKAALYTVDYLFEDELADENFIQNKDVDFAQCDKNADGSLTDECKNRYANRMWSELLSYDCADCQVQIKSPYILNLHYNLKHPDGKSTFVCKLCSDEKTFYNFEAFVNHTFIMHHEHLRNFCFICNKGYWDYKALFRHYKTEHEDYNIFICIYCGKHHKVGYELKTHMQIHSKSKSNQMEKEDQGREKSAGLFNCHDCPKTFLKKTHLQRHLETHKKSEQKIWICELCGKNFNAKSTLINHAMVHMNDKPFKCDTCGEGFKNKYKLNYHKGIHTGEKNFACEICAQRFRAKGTLKNHMLTHSGERPWNCEFCDKKFSAKYDLSVHTRLHTGEYTHECQICHERYPSWSNYSKHMRGRHQIDPRSEKKKKYDALHKGLQEQKITEEVQSSSQHHQQQEYY